MNERLRGGIELISVSMWLAGFEVKTLGKPSQASLPF